MVDVNDLTIEEKIGQMIMVGLDSTYITERTKKLILKYKVGGIILYRKNFKTYEDLLNLIRELKNLNRENKVPLFISIDQEGGRVNRMPKEILNLPAANKLASLKDVEIIRKSARITGKILKSSGISMNFSPVLDIKRFEDNHAIGDRCYGKTSSEVIEYGIPVMEELKSQGIISVVKHFPGHGATIKDSHFMLPVINTPIKKLEKEDMEVFNQAIKRGADAVLVGHLRIRQLTGIFPASLSRNFIIRTLRGKYRFRGLVISDDLKMRAIRFVYGELLAIKKAFEAGNDVVVFRFNQKKEETAIKDIIDLVKKNRIKEFRINRSVKRILQIKGKYGITDVGNIEGINIEEVNNEINNLRAFLS